MDIGEFQGPFSPNVWDHCTRNCPFGGFSLTITSKYTCFNIFCLPGHDLDGPTHSEAECNLLRQAHVTAKPAVLQLGRLGT